MFVAPWARRRGLGQKLLQALHSTATRQGANMVILVPSQMTREMRFYEQFNYSVITPILLFIPDKSN